MKKFILKYNEVIYKTPVLAWFYLTVAAFLSAVGLILLSSVLPDVIVLPIVFVIANIPFVAPIYIGFIYSKKFGRNKLWWSFVCGLAGYLGIWALRSSTQRKIKIQDKTMDKKTTYLNSHAWYRFLKVAYIFLILCSFGFINFLLLADESSFKTFAIVNIVLIAIYEAIRRAFYYIVLGTISPKK